MYVRNTSGLEDEETDQMTIKEVVRLNEWLKAMGTSDHDILDCQHYIATGVGLPMKLRDAT